VIDYQELIKISGNYRFYWGVHYFQITLLNYLNQVNKTIILTIHDIHLAIKFFKNFIIMKNGKIYSTILNEKIFKEVFSVSIDNFL
jgi:ABC-type cobalamin/Fe3+-siderophores transport system ATPase subunit